jgi:hypothetical protein
MGQLADLAEVLHRSNLRRRAHSQPPQCLRFHSGLTGVAFLTSPRNIAPIVSRLRFEAIDNLRIEWDFDYDTKAGRVGADNVFAGYSFGRTTIGLVHALLNAADESGSTASVIQSQQVQPFLYFGKPSDVGLSVAMNASYDFTHDSLQYGGVEAIYNWNCCGLNVGYRRFALGSCATSRNGCGDSLSRASAPPATSAGAPQSSPPPKP